MRFWNDVKEGEFTNLEKGDTYLQVEVVRNGKKFGRSATLPAEWWDDTVKLYDVIKNLSILTQEDVDNYERTGSHDRPLP